MKEDSTDTHSASTTPSAVTGKDIQPPARGGRLTAEEEALCFEALSSARKNNDPVKYERFFNKIYASNIPLAASCASKYKKAGVDPADVDEEALIALYKSIGDYRGDKGAKFSTFATMRIGFALLEALNGHFRHISVPRNRTKILDKMRKAKERFTAANGRPPTRQELMKAADITRKEMESAEEIDFKYMSLNAEVGEGDDTCCPGDFIEDPKAPSPSAELDNKFIMERLHAAIESLPFRERWILGRRTFPLAQGLDSAATYEEIGRQLKISKVAARNLEKRAIASLRASRALRDLAQEYGIVA